MSEGTTNTFDLRYLTGKIWCARVDSNHWPFAPEANALSRLSYGRFRRDLTLRNRWMCGGSGLPNCCAATQRQQFLNPLANYRLG